MQETQETRDGSSIVRQEFFVGKDGMDVEGKMEARLAELEKDGHVLVRRVRVGRNDPCPCGARKENGQPRKFKHCCISKVR